MLDHTELLKLKRWNTPTIYNGWEQITKSDTGKDGINLEETTDFMPQMGPKFWLCRIWTNQLFTVRFGEK